MKKGSRESLDGKRFGRLTVIKCVGSDKWKKRVFLCKCDCGNYKEVSSALLMRGEAVSCGCYHKEIIEKSKTQDGLSTRKVYTLWNNIKSRCYNKNFKQYKDYGGRGITVCDEWLGENGLKNFAEWAYKNGYDENAPRGKCTIDRINNNKGYSPDNCRFVDMKEQAKNKRNSKKNNFTR